MYDMIIIGGGPAGLSAAIYMARAKYKTLVIEKEKFGGQITITSEIVNYPGIYKTSGTQLTNSMQKQAEAFGAEFKISEVLEMDLDSDIKTIKTTTGEYKTLGVILAVGASPRKVGFIGENEFAGRGVAYCATCDGEFFTDKTVYVVGGGFAAVEESIFLTKYAKEVIILVRGNEFSCAKTVSDKLKDEPKISVLFNTQIQEVTGDEQLKSIKYINSESDREVIKEYTGVFGVFVFAGYVPNTKWFSDKVQCENGYIVTNNNQETNVEGVYGAGDVCIKELRQVVTAVSDGAQAATTAEKYVEKMHSKLGLPPFEIALNRKEEQVEQEQKLQEEDGEDGKFISKELVVQIKAICEKFDNIIVLKGGINNTELGQEIKNFLEEFSVISPNVKCEIEEISENEAYIEIFKQNGKSSGIKYNAVPGGHEFNSFILAMYNVAGPGTDIIEEDVNKIKNIEKCDIKVLISLSCTMCPDVVVATQKMASLNDNISATAIDITHFPEIKEKYNVMSVPCIVINDKEVQFGRKNLQEIISMCSK